MQHVKLACEVNYDSRSLRHDRQTFGYIKEFPLHKHIYIEEL